MKIKMLVVFSLLVAFSPVAVHTAGGGHRQKSGGTRTEESGGNETITVLMSFDTAGKSMGDRAAEFERRTGIRVNLVLAEWDLMVEKQSLSLGVRDPAYDVVNCGPFMLGRYVQKGLYEDLSDLFPHEKRERYLEGMIDAVSVDGKVFAVPLMASWFVMFYNIQMFDEVGLDPGRPPRSWSDVIRDGRSLRTGSSYAMAESIAPGENTTVAFLAWAKSAGAWIHRWEDGKILWSLDSSECVAAARFMKRLIEDGVMDPASPTYQPRQVARMFGTGGCAILMGWDMMRSTFMDPMQSPYGDKIKTASVPGVGEATSGAVEGHQYLAIPTPSLHKEAAKSFISYITSVANVRRRALEQGMTPVYTELLSDPAVKKVIDRDTIIRAQKNGYRRPSIPEYGEISRIISRELQNILVNNRDVRSALREVNLKANSISGEEKPQIP